MFLWLLLTFYLIRVCDRLDRPAPIESVEATCLADVLLAMANGAVSSLISLRASADPFGFYRVGGPHGRGRFPTRAAPGPGPVRRARARSAPSSPSGYSERAARRTCRPNVAPAARNSRSPSPDPAMPPLDGCTHSVSGLSGVHCRQSPAMTSTAGRQQPVTSSRATLTPVVRVGQSACLY